MLLVHVYYFRFKELGDVESHGGDHDGDDVGGSPPGDASSGGGLSVVEGVTHGDVPSDKHGPLHTLLFYPR